MAVGRLIVPNAMPALDLNGDPVPGAKLYFYSNETTTLATTYTSSALTTAHPNPVVADAAGVFPSIFADNALAFSVAITDADGAPIINIRNRDNLQASTYYGDFLEDERDAYAAELAAAGDLEVAVVNAAGAAQVDAVEAAGAAAIADIDDASAAIFYESTAAGIAGTVDGEFFKIVSDGRILTYENVSEVATLRATAPSVADVEDIEVAVSPFADGVTLSQALRERVKDIRLFDVEDHKNYSLDTFIIEVNGLKKRLRIGIWNNTLSKIACYVSWSSADGATVADFIATLPEWITLTDSLVSPSSDKRRVLGHIQLDLSGITDVFANIGSTSLLIHKDNQYTLFQQAGYLSDDRADVVLMCGASQTYTTFDAAMTASYAANSGSSNVNGQPVSDEASFFRRVRIFLTDEATYTFTGTALANFVEIDGGPGAELYCASPSTAGAIEAHGTHKVRNVKITHGSTTKYALHMDDAGRSVTANGQNGAHRKSAANLTLINPAGSTAAVLGGGISSLEEWDLTGLCAVNLNAAATVAAIGVHNTGVRASVPGSLASPYGATVDLRGASSPNLIGLDLSSVAAGPVNTARLGANTFNMVAASCYIADADAPDRAADRYVWNILGNYDGPVRFSDDRGQSVLATTAGQTPSGTAASLIFGTVDELGRGDLWIKTGTTKSLGARLGDCSSVNKTLTIGAQTHTFTTNLTAASNTTIISAINATLTTYPVSEVDIQTEYVAPCQPQARMTNSTGATIPKGRFVKRTGASTVALAGPGDTIFGWTYREILNGSTGIVVTSRKAHENQIEGATASTGTWGLAAGGLLDYGAATAVGSTMGSIVEY